MSEERDLKEAKKVLLEQAQVLGLKVDARWSVDTLAEKVLEAQEQAKEASVAAELAAADTWVFLLRDGFPAEDVKKKAGETVKVSHAIAERWFEAGVARPAKAPAE
jgi:hypothetical protein